MSAALGIRYLTGWSCATHPADRESPEWPPHPDRIFSALAAAYYETDEDPEEKAALEWLEKQDPQEIVASPWARRTSVTYFVPVNDTKPPSLKDPARASDEQVAQAISLLPERRSKQARFFPVAVPFKDTVFVRLPEPPETVRRALAGLCRKVGYLGHSSSLVQLWLADELPSDRPDRLVPASGQTRYRLRVPGPGRLQALGEAYRSGRRPQPALWCGYDPTKPLVPPTETISTVFDRDLLVLSPIPTEAAGKFGLVSTLVLAAALRDTVMSLCSDPVPEWVSGHEPDGKPSQQPHLAIVPLAHVGRSHADGRLMGMALIVPRGQDTSYLNPLLFLPTGELRTLTLKLGRLGTWSLQLMERETPPVSLRPETWTRPCSRWATVTPIVLDRYPKGDAEEIVATGCERLGLPRPVEVCLAKATVFEGTPLAREFPGLRLKATSGAFRHQLHAVLTFARPVSGPLIVGAGRYRGYGLCRPYPVEVG